MQAIPVSFTANQLTDLYIVEHLWVKVQYRILISNQLAQFHVLFAIYTIM